MTRKLVAQLKRSAFAASTLFEMLLPFARSVALARLLPPDQVGIGVTLSVVYGIAEQVSDIGLNFSAVRSSDKASQDEVYATLHSLQIIRGAMLCAIIVCCSPLLGMAFDTPQAVWAYVLLGMSMFGRSFSNFGLKEAMRSYVFWPEALAVIAGQVFWTVVNVALAWWIKDYSAVIFGVLANVVLYVLMSHILSQRRWRLGWNKPVVQEVIAYGRPLMPNGMSNAFIQLADRFVVGSRLGVVPLAVYNITMVTALLPRNAVCKLLNMMFMTVLVNMGPEEARRSHVHEFWTMLLSALGFSYAIFLMSFGPMAIGLIFGHVYQPTMLVMGLVAINICAKFCDQLPVPASLAFGQTSFILYGTIAAAAGVALAIVTLITVTDFEYFIMALALGEVLAVVWITYRTIRLHKFKPMLTWSFVFGPIGVLVLLMVSWQLRDWNLVEWAIYCMVVGVAVLATMLSIGLRNGVHPVLVLKAIREAYSMKKEAAAQAAPVAL